MRNTANLNKQQKDYMQAKAICDAMYEQMKANETQFIVEAGIKNPNGETPKFLFQIEDEKIFDKACEDYQNSPLFLDDKYADEKIKLVKAEDALIEYGLSIVPSSVRETLEKGKHIARIREKLIDLVFRLDTRTV